MEIPTPTPTLAENWLVQLTQSTVSFQTIIEQYEAQQTTVVEEQLELLGLRDYHPSLAVQPIS